MNNPQDPLDSLLDRWGRSTPESERIEPEVWRRIAVDDTADHPGIFERIRIVFSRPSFSIAFAAACILFGLFLVQLRISHREARRNVELAQNYLRLVDPLLQVQNGGDAANRAEKNDSLDSLLAWMKSDLNLSDQQLARIRSVHEQFGPHLTSLASRVAQMRQELAAFEQARQSVGEIDFLEFARFVEQRRNLNRECSESTRKLVAESSDVMTPRQREQYLQLLDPALKSTSGGSL